MTQIQFEYINERGILVILGNEISMAYHQKVMNLYHFLTANPMPFQMELVPSYSSLGIYFDIKVYSLTNNLIEWTSDFVNQIRIENQIIATDKVFEIPVNYTGSDLPEVENRTGLSKIEIIELHTQPIYTVAMLGFLPGFPYLLGLDNRLQIPRKTKPQPKVPKGSVAIGGFQTGIYPCESPGGWHIIGYTQTELYFKDISNITLLLPGDKVKFVSV